MSLRSLLSPRLRIAGLSCATLALAGVVLPAQSAEAPAFNTDLTLSNIMEFIVMPAADALWKAVSVDVSAEGSKNVVPETEEQWLELRHEAMTLAGATNLLLVPGLNIDTPPESDEHPDGELSPKAIAKLRQENLAAWAAHAKVLHETALHAIEAIDKRDATAVSDIGGDLDAACESCHLQFWYPGG